jgi:dihydroorotase-like cyclic amidohydrolase
MPPVRSKDDIESLWKGVRNGSIDIIASDHAPHVAKEKETKNVWQTKVGISGLETTVALLLTQINKGTLSLNDMVRLMTENPARIFHLKDRGFLKAGYHADLTIIDLQKKGKIEAADFHSKAKYSPFDGWNIKGIPIKTVVNGEIVMDEGDIVTKTGVGEILRGE